MKIGFLFRECSGGYDVQLDDNRFDFIFNDDLDIFVRFEMGDSRIVMYNLDLDKMELSGDYRVY